ncbi:MAG TPA: serine/threonine protein kinase [Xanthobacteraceae bacterium]|nr:serine/threonine protein kinase [Xanthobacteraceae bacterium]
MDASKSRDEFAGRWRPAVVLKHDLLSTVERGRFLGPDGDADAVMRRIDRVPWWTRPIARHFLNREARALAVAGSLGVAPQLLHVGADALVRRFIDGVALHIARPLGDRAYFRSAKAALSALHRAGICHNDLAKEQNWLRGADGRAYLTDFQLAARFRRRGRLFRIAAYEDLRHLLKHKRSYAPEALTFTERRVLARKSLFTRVWMASGKRVYYWITRGIIGFTDREGGGPRLVDDAPTIAARFQAHAQVRGVAVVAFPDRRSGTGLYAFVEAEPPLTEAAARDFIAGAVGRAKAPEHLQLVASLPRNAAGEVRTEILQLIAMNQVDLIAPLLGSDAERQVVDRIVRNRQNLRDRFAF